jgi:serine/tyrosine/threonine adenylyltransferase
MRAKLGIADGGDDDQQLIGDLATQMQALRVDFTSFFRALAHAADGDADPVRAMFGGSVLFDTWLERWRRRSSISAPAMNRVNPIYIARNHLVEAALGAATDGDLGPVQRLLDVLVDPFTERTGLEEYAVPAPGGSSGYRTYCGT